MKSQLIGSVGAEVAGDLQATDLDCSHRSSLCRRWGGWEAANVFCQAICETPPVSDRGSPQGFARGPEECDWLGAAGKSKSKNKIELVKRGAHMHTFRPAAPAVGV